MRGHLDPGPIAERAVELFVEESYNCAEGVVAAFSEARGEAPGALARAVTGFAGGIGSLGHVCGALAGALVVLGRESAERNVSSGAVREGARDLYLAFEQRFGTASCRALTHQECGAANGAPCELGVCGKYLRFAVEKVIELIEVSALPRA